MPLNVNDYYESLMAHVFSLAEVGGAYAEKEFLGFTLELLVDAGEFEDYELIDDGRDATGRWRIDAYGFNEEARHLNLFISVFDQSQHPSNLTQTDLSGLIKKLVNTVTYSVSRDPYSFFEPTSQICEAAVNIKAKWETLRSLRFFIISNKPASKRIENLPEIDVMGVKAETAVWDLNRLFQLEQSGKDREEMVVDFSASPLPCLVTDESSDDMTSILTVMPGETLYRLYDRWGARLLEQNVRSYLQNRSKVNKGIRLTIKDEPNRFFAYNNGLTTTAEAVEFVDESRTAIKSINNLQIVNGGQTTSSIYAAVVNDKVDVSAVSIQMKLSVVEPDAVGRLVPFISRFANSQNKVSDADLFANHPFHVHFEEMSRRISCSPKAGSAVSTKWFYERARGQYLDQQAYLTQAQRKAFQKQNPRSQLLTKTDLAKIENTWRMLPSDVSRGAQANFNKFAEIIDKAWNADKSVFGEGYFKKCVVHAVIFRELEKYIQEQRWYAGFRANIVTYAIALFSDQLVGEGKSLNYEHLFRSQQTPIQILEHLGKIGFEVDRVLKSFPGNLTTFAKGAAAWGKMKDDVEMPSLDDLDDAFFWSLSDIKEYEKDSKATAKIDNTLQLEMKVRLLGAEHWRLIKTFIIDMDEATEMKIGLLDQAISGRSLSDRQCKVLAPLLAQYEEQKGAL